MSPKPPAAPDAERLASRLRTAAERGSRPREIALTCLATAVGLLGMPFDLAPHAYRGIAQAEGQRITTLRSLWEMFVKASPYLADIINPLVDWIDRPGEFDDDAIGRCFGYLAGIDIYATVERAQGEILGAVYQQMLGMRNDPLGRIYTPMNAARMMAAMVDMDEGKSFCDPCCGTGGMAVAAILEMRARGKDPRTCLWVLNDIDGLAVAMAGVNMAARGIPHVRLSRADALADPEAIGAPPEAKVTRRRAG